MYDLIIIGAGPAGLTAAIYAARAKMRFLLLEQRFPGGKLSWIELLENIPGFPKAVSGPHFAELLFQQVSELGCEIRFEQATNIQQTETGFIVHSPTNTFETKAVLAASGSEPRKLGVPGEVELLGKGVSYCALCDGFFFKNKIVAVVGEGKTADAEAEYLKKLATVIRIKKDGLASREGEVRGTLLSIHGSEKVEQISIESSSGQEMIKVDGVFIFAGFTTSVAFLPSEIQRTSAKFLPTDSSFQTTVPGIYACGDVRAGSMKQVIVACAEAAQAVEHIRKNVSQRS
ncbi:MAG: FAD-dependent oxidoreductase [Candidatus Ratteibacteria bacterium]|jgi:thioredoxin reductase (NADPH)